jgi:hypothetical protein
VYLRPDVITSDLEKTLERVEESARRQSQNLGQRIHPQ